MNTSTTARLPKSKHDITETRWNMQQSREDAMERNWQERSELNRLAQLFA
mgnify:FL=1